MLRASASPDCARLLGPLVPGATLPGGARIPGTSYELDPVQAAWNLALLLHWEAPDAPPQLADPLADPLADSLAAALAVADWSARCALLQGLRPITVGELLERVMGAERADPAATPTPTPTPEDCRQSRVQRRADAIAATVRHALRAGAASRPPAAGPLSEPARAAGAAAAARAVLPDEFTTAVTARLSAKRATELLALAADRSRLEATPVNAFVALLVTN
jgi:hypothetical protein